MWLETCLDLIGSDVQFQEPDNVDCARPGEVLTYTCNTNGGGTTVWRGNAFDCIFNEILLRHSQFASPGTSGTCNNNAMRARSVGVVNTDSYISELSVTISTTFNNRIIQCSHNLGFGERIIGTSTLTVVSGKNRLLVTIIVSQASSRSQVAKASSYVPNFKG